ncbi:BCCT family transporter [Pseudoalteromonas sp.]|uniref:BCCT family transporter n=1 Tax=Pseudoalteromonas sp. TaxID=53249 RepID=UPI003564A7E1
MDDTVKKYSIDTTDYQVGQDNVQKWGFDIHNPVFGISAFLVVLFVTLTLIFDPAVSRAALTSIKDAIVNQFDSYFMLVANGFVLFCLLLALSPLGKIQLGGRQAKPEHGYLSWLAMLFAAGMGIGLLFWGVAEPTAYFTGWYHMPMNAEPNSLQAHSLALGATMYHWGLHGWSIYAVVGLSLAFFAYNKGLPLSIRSVFYPIFGDRAWGWLGHIIDILAVLSTLFGLATSLGLGAQQATSGINYLLGTDYGTAFQIAVICLVTCIAILSVIRGIEGGVKVLSNINLICAFILLLVIIAVTFSDSLAAIWFTVGAYAQHIVPLSNPFDRADENWMHAWTVFYWAWWISWSPFVGMFIARVSKGRTVREFLLIVIGLPTLLSLVWMGVFGNMAINQVIEQVGPLGQQGLTDISVTLFQVYEQLPFASVISVISIALILVFFITSSDSGSLVIDGITAGGKIDSPVPQRIFWATIEGIIAAILLWIGGSQALQALQSGVVTTALPFSIVLILICLALVQGLISEYPLYKAPSNYQAHNKPQ